MRLSKKKTTAVPCGAAVVAFEARVRIRGLSSQSEEQFTRASEITQMARTTSWELEQHQPSERPEQLPLVASELLQQPSPEPHERPEQRQCHSKMERHCSSLALACSKLELELACSRLAPELAYSTELEPLGSKLSSLRST